MASAFDSVADLHYVGSGALSVCLARYRYSAQKRIDNITDWALDQFLTQYNPSKITKNDIFAYVYSVLHDHIYRETYTLNLKREFPRIPLYQDFFKWRDWGKTLLDLHINYETAKPFPLKRIDTKDKKPQLVRPVLRADRDAGIIILDSETQLSGVPASAWDYKLGNRSAIDWVLDQHKEKTPKDPTIREKFNTYRFADYKEQVIDLLKRVTTVSVETVKITEAMRALPRE
jgi:predicted helicase